MSQKTLALVAHFGTGGAATSEEDEQRRLDSLGRQSWGAGTSPRWLTNPTHDL